MPSNMVHHHMLAVLLELLNENNIRETIAFPKNGSGVDVMMDSPGAADPKSLRELGL